MNAQRRGLADIEPRHVSNQWRGVEEIEQRYEFLRVCPQHHKPVTSGAKDAMLCPEGHKVSEDDFLVVRKPAARPQPAPQPEPKNEPATNGVEPMKGLGTGRGSRVVDSMGFHTLGGHRMYQAQGKGWRVGIPRRSTGLTDIPDAPTSISEATSSAKRKRA